jgi:hypothetical protein
VAIAWMLLTDVRERHQRSAMQEVARDQRELEAREAEAEQARREWQQQLEAKAQHWKDTVGALSDGACSVAQMRQAGAWSKALDLQIAQAGMAVVEAQAVVAQAQDVLDASRAHLRRASAELEKAKQMQQRVRAEERALQERRQDELTEEVSVQGWSVAQRA